MNKKLLILLSMMLSTSIFAKNIYEAQNGDTINANISASDLTRIEVAGQKIIKDFSAANISKKITKPLGQIYVLPNINTTFNLYIISDKGNTYNLHLTPVKKMQGDSIIIKPLDVAEVQPTAKAIKTSSYIRNINYLLQSMYLNQDDKQYSIDELNQAIMTYQNLDSMILKKYHDDNLIGYVLLIKNVSKAKVLLTEAQFYTAHTLAVAIENPNLLVNEFTRIFIVKDGE